MWARIHCNHILSLFAFAILVLACRATEEPKKAKAASNPSAKPEARPPLVKKEDFRFDGKDFDHWRTALRTELKPERRLEALDAIKAFASNGYSKEVAQAIFDMAKTYKGELTDKDKEVFQKAFLVFRDIAKGNERLLEESLGDDNKPARSLAVAVLACHVQSISKGAVPGLVRAVVDGEKDEWVAVPALAKIDGIESLLKKEFQDEKKAKKFVKVLTGIIEKEAIANFALLVANDDEKKDLAMAVYSAPSMAVCLLGAMGPAAKDAVPCLLKSLKTDFPFSPLAIVSAEALGQIGAEPEQVIPALVAALKKDNDALRFTAARALGRFGPRAKIAVPALRETLGNKDLNVCLTAFVALDKIGEPTAKTIPVVIDALKKSDRTGRLKVYESIQKETDLAPVQVLVPVLILAFEQIADDRLEIAATLGHFGSLAKEATGCLTSALEDKNPKVRQGAADAIQKIRMEKK